MSDLHVKVAGAWKAIDDASVKVSGAWKQVDNIYVKVSGAWKTVWTNLVIALSDANPVNSLDLVGNGELALVGYKVKRDGTVEDAENQNTSAPLVYSFRENWATPTSATIGDAYHVRFTDNGQTGAAGTRTGTFGSWLALTSDRTISWQKDTDTNGTATMGVTVEISDDGGSTTLTSVTFNMVATDSP